MRICMFSFFCISTIVDYLMPNPVFTYIYIYIYIILYMFSKHIFLDTYSQSIKQLFF